MVVKRQCSFCAAEIEPGTGTMFVKRDGTVFHFCSSSCRKQQLHLGRVGHRFKWTRAHSLKVTADRAGPAKPAEPEPAHAPRPARRPSTKAPTAATPLPATSEPATSPAPPAESPAAAAPAAPTEPAPAAAAESEAKPPRRTRSRKKPAPPSPPAE